MKQGALYALEQGQLLLLDCLDDLHLEFGKSVVPGSWNRGSRALRRRPPGQGNAEILAAKGEKDGGGLGVDGALNQLGEKRWSLVAADGGGQHQLILSDKLVQRQFLDRDRTDGDVRKVGEGCNLANLGDRLRL